MYFAKSPSFAMQVKPERFGHTLEANRGCVLVEAMHYRYHPLAHRLARNYNVGRSRRD